MQKMRPILLICIVLLVINAGCMSAHMNEHHKKDGGEVVSNSFTIKARGSYEECIELKPGQVFDYDYSSSNFVDFNIHYHGEDKVHYPAQNYGRMMGQGMIDPETQEYYTPSQEYYCLMWDNPNNETVKVSFSCTLRYKHH